MTDLNDRIAKALGVGAVEKADSETIIAALVALVTDVNHQHTLSIDVLHETIDDLEFDVKTIREEQVQDHRRGQQLQGMLLTMLAEFQTESEDEDF